MCRRGYDPPDEGSGPGSSDRHGDRARGGNHLRCRRCSTSGSCSSPARAGSASRPSRSPSASRRRGGASARSSARSPLRSISRTSSTAPRSATTRSRWRTNLWAISIDPDESMREYVLLQLKVRAMRDLLFRSRIFTYLAAATPGLKELVTIGKIWELALDDRKVEDGHTLRPRDRRRAGDRSRGRLPPDAADVREHRPGRAAPPAGGDARRVHPRPGTDRRRGRRAAGGDAGERDGDARAAARLGGRGRGRPRSSATGSTRSASTTPRRSGSSGSPRTATIRSSAPRCRAALTQSRRARAQREQLARLEETARAPMTTLPYLFSPELGREADRRAGARLRR